MGRSRKDVKVAVYARTEQESFDAVRVPIADALSEAAKHIDDGPDFAARSELVNHLEEAYAGIMPGHSLFAAADSHGYSNEATYLMRAIAAPDSRIEHLVVPDGDDDYVAAVSQAALREGISVHITTGPWCDGSGVMRDVLDRRAGAGEEWTGRPPLGFRVEGGHLVESDDYSAVSSVLRLVQTGQLSKRAAADELSTSRRTIGRCLDAPERYGLPE